MKNHYSVEVTRARYTIEKRRRKIAEEAVRLQRGGREEEDENNILFPIKSISNSARSRGPTARAIRYIEALSQTGARGKATKR